MDKLVPVQDSRNKRIKNLYQRSGRYFFYGSVRGRRYKRQIPFTDRPKAIQWIKSFVKTINDDAGDSHMRDWAARCAYPTIQTLIHNYRAECERRGHPRETTVRNNINSLLIIIDRGSDGKRDPLTQRADVLTSDLIKRYADRLLENADPGEPEERTRRTIASTIRQARSVFADKISSAYKSFTMPDLTEFKKEYIVNAPIRRYTVPAYEEITPILQAGEQLASTRPELYAVFILAYYVGMRASEIMAARWSWIDYAGDGIYQMRIIPRPDELFKPKGRAGMVPIHVSNYDAIDSIRRHDDEFIVPGGTPTARRHVVNYMFSQWMRSLGWNRRKTAHELRMYRGHLWRKHYGLDVAHDWLRHANMQTTLDYYADIVNDKQPLPNGE